ncbi:MAG TPA: hypothetical protein DCO79_03435 [Spirochaeta sp.]|nr:hypothetical protein [Spirochaeta sp.]
MKRILYFVFILIAAAGSFLLISMGGREKLDKRIITVNGIDIEAEIADDSDSRRNGLMNRKSMPENSGMLFIFDSDQKLSFWMKNTIIPLSIAYVAADGEIMEIYDMKPESLRPVESAHSVRYALEMNQGWFVRNGVSTGDIIELD